jgi:hypothetical protein
MSIDVEIYIKKVINFFEDNPDSLNELIGDLNKETFYNELKEVIHNNFKVNAESGELTRKQLLDIVIKLSGAKPINKKLSKFIQETSIGVLFLN